MLKFLGGKHTLLVKSVRKIIQLLAGCGKESGENEKSKSMIELLIDVLTVAEINQLNPKYKKALENMSEVIKKSVLFSNKLQFITLKWIGTQSAQKQRQALYFETN